MIFENLIINHDVWTKIQKTFKNNKIPNAYIFSGIDGVGKEAHAIELAALLNCKRLNNNESNNACGDCRSCLRIKSFQHEEVHYIHPLPALKNNKSSKKLILDSATIEEINKFQKQKIKNPYCQINLKGANTIPINAIRDIKKKLFYTKGDNNWSVVIITEAEKLCLKRAEAANSLLKILEEPPENTLFILITSKINLITPTILSRCQKLFFPRLKDSTLNDFIVKENLENSIKEGSIQLSHGNMRELNEIISTDRVDNLKKIIKYFYSDKINNIEKLLSTMNEINTKNKTEFLKYLSHLKICTKDLYALSNNGSKNFINYEFLNQNYEQISSLYPNSNWEKIINLLDECIRDSKNNINFTLSLYSLMINIQRCLKNSNYNITKSELIKGI